VVSGNTLVTPGNLPPRHGIDYFLGLTSGSRTYFTGQTSSYQQVLREQTLDPVTGIVNDVNREGSYPANTYVTDLLAGEAADYITQRAGGADPFFVTLSFTAPHGPLQATQQYFDYVDANIPGLSGDRRTYAAMMVAMDMGVQVVLDRLEDPDQDGDTSDSITGDTLICFINDNGGETANSARNFPLRGKKSDTFDGGIRVMMTMAGPGIPATGSSYDDPVDSADLVPTFAAAAGVPLGPGDFTDGVNLLPYLDGTIADPPHREIYVRGNNPLVAGLRREDEWKLTIENIGGPFLYDIIANIGESNVLNGAFPELVDELTDLMHGYEAEYTKPRWGPTDFNPFDGFVYRAGVVGSAGWGTDGAWSGEGGSPSTATLYPRDGYANLRMTFPVRASAYTASNTLSRPNFLSFMGNEIVFSGTHAGAGDSGATIEGLPVMLTDSLSGVAPAIRMDTTSTGSGSHPAEIALDVYAWEDVEITGSGDQTLVVSGGLREERPGRSYTKTGSFPMEVRGLVDVSGGFAVNGGTVSVLGSGSMSPGVLFLGAGGSLRLADPSGSGGPDLIGNETALMIETPEAGPGGAAAPVALDYEGVEVVGSVAVDGQALIGDFFDASSHPACSAARVACGSAVPSTARAM
jgi:hypothetical protein